MGDGDSEGHAYVINSHLENSLNYILQEKKLGEEHLCAGINCMVSGAYGQMMETKEMFGKTGGRQGYHFVISLKLGEGTPQEIQALREMRQNKARCRINGTEYK